MLKVKNAKMLKVQKYENVKSNAKINVIDTKYSRHWPYTVAHTIECVCRKCQIMD